MLLMFRPLHHDIHRKARGQVEGRRSKRMQDRDWVERLSRLVEALTPDGIRAVCELIRTVLAGLAMLAILACAVFAMDLRCSFDTTLIPWLIILKLLDGSRRHDRAGR
jgi:hypothetical protein